MPSILKQLQARRSAALTAMDWQQHDAFDILIGVLLNETEMFARTNSTLNKAREETLEEIDAGA
jgi:hypothetical protein